MSDKPSRGVYYVKNEDMPEFMKGVGSQFQIVVALYRWAYSKNGGSRDGIVSEWMVVLQ